MTMQSEESILLARIIEQNNVIIALLGKIAFTKEEVINIVVSGKQKTKKQKYAEGYNACDGEHSVSDLAKIVGVNKGTLSPILQGWEEIGIVYPVIGTRTGKFYRKIFSI
jgi:hypothetical protein